MEETGIELIETATALIGLTQYQTVVNSGGHGLITDEPLEAEGSNTGMNPFSLLLASLASCTVITLRMYINRKMWPIEEIKADVEMFKTLSGTRIETKISFKGEVNDEQRDRLLKIANACPVHKILTGNIAIRTNINP
ncbi:OsmC family protein [Mucilaginibacter rubeus]|uniref:OsmC family protein n=1 Tax=Mucilaginibacter rubeus TaxID=2027860 RepID=A0AAE6JG73_9SPHI|nr:MULTISPECIES: OsmC family protein [Mucilaginibacter]QEM04172.1 OsmC family protein [Mucilaginibacter rubeus]QEM16775.1 OsmC family protein [Mucilaginibacter gossypii]QTE38248.1 OsmC family protein [Mucilaginibacter gossypii]QTE46748.1 OsmC family protein [Mucilaginibacter rubeus]QTE53345.1 OsmC family protein [Mucilaginibacter rubeus]